MTALWLAAFFLSAGAARAADLASLQIAIAVPDPVVAGDMVQFQVLAVNIGDQSWQPNQYYWQVELFDLDKNYIGQTDRLYPTVTVAPGGSSAATVQFVVPQNFLGRKLYRVVLGHLEQRLIESDYGTFRVTERPILPPPETPYKFGGNLTLQGSDSTEKGVTGAETLNLVGKMQDSSLLVNAYILNDSTHTIDPYILYGAYYAPWGTISAGDLLPDFNPLALEGQGLRGGMLEQKKDWGRWSGHWTALYGQSSSAQAGSATTNGRYARDLLAGRAGVASPWHWTFDLDYVLGTDNTGSLSSDPQAANFRGPTLTPESNPVVGAVWKWTPTPSWDASLNLQKSSLVADTEISTTSVSDSAERAQIGFHHGIWKATAWYQKTGQNFEAFGSPTAIPDRVTQDVEGSVSPTKWLDINALYNSFKDNLENDPSKTTTKQTIMNLGSSIRVTHTTNVTLGLSQNTALGDPQSALNTNTTTLSFGASQALGPHYFSANFQQSAFKDSNQLAHDLNTTTIGLNGNVRLPRQINASLGVTNVNTADQTDGSSRKSNTISASVGIPINARMHIQLWGTSLSSKSDSTVSPADLSTTNFNAELTWQHSAKLGYTVGLGKNQTTDNITPSNSVSETLLTGRVSYNF